ncbi:uncharacterized protein LOC112271117 [Brachypodium distachyon]|nr:uncharacterized protein LOC112271117 [Brachypodium distachyon]|eukprot:XP_024315895.1 uncharacterized protein LOC112271117 [Brachypodium distachyon]
MATKVKLLQRELKTVKADLAFSKERCAQLEEENRLLRDGKHDAVADEDLIRQQLETLLEEKARLANENTLYARENGFLRDVVELHQLNMQDMVSLHEDTIEEEEDQYDEDEEDADDQSICSPFCVEHAMPPTPSTPPQSPALFHADDNAAATPLPSPSFRAENAQVLRMDSCRDATFAASGSPLRRSSKEEDGSQQQTTPTQRSFEDDNCSTEMTDKRPMGTAGAML